VEFNFNNFGSSEKILASIKKLSKHNWSKFNTDDYIENFISNIRKMLSSEFGALYYLPRQLDVKNFNFNIYRVRELENLTNKDLLCEHSYLPVNLTTKLGRCNFPNHPVFYCSNDAMTSINEVIRKTDFIGKKYCISSWGIQGRIKKIKFVPFFGELNKENPFNILKVAFWKDINKHTNNSLNDDQVNALKIYIDYLAELFNNDEEYSLSATLAYAILYETQNGRPDILIYPSIQNDKKGNNMAMNPNFVDQNLYLKKLLTIKITGRDIQGNFLYEIVEYGDISSNSIEWNQCCSNAERDELNNEFFR
jgi:hypothetical protein